MKTKDLILASSSPYRQELLARLGLAFRVEAPDIDESPLAGETPLQIALRLCQKKALHVAQSYPDALIIGCDQVATLDGAPIGKPGNFDNAAQQLRMMRGRTVTFHSALCLYNAATGSIQADSVDVDVEFRAFSDSQIKNYLEREQPYNCAGSAKSEGLGICLIAAIKGNDPNALIGLPLIRLVSMLEAEGLDVLSSQ